MYRAIVWLITLGVALVIGASVTRAQSSDPLAGTQWQLESYTASQGEMTISPATTITLAFQTGNRLGGSGGCNSYGASYTVSGNQLSIGPIVSTKMACAQGMQDEQAYLAALQSASRFDLSGDRLTITYAGGKQLNFTRSSGVLDPGQGGGPGAQPPTPPFFESLGSPVELLASYYNAIEQRDYRRAYGYWNNPRQSFDSFASGFAETASVQLIVQPPTRYEGAAGSVYASVPTVIVAWHTDNTQHVFAGCFTTRRASIQAGSNLPGDVWHIHDANLSEVTSDSSIPALLSQACPP